MLCCGGRGLAGGASYAAISAAVIEAAKRDRAAGGSICKLAQTPERAEELIGLTSPASRLAHLFSKTAEPLRCQLRLDAEAHFSVTDEDMADKFTDAIAQLPGVSPATPVVDATACVGGNALSFAKRFARVVAIENDAGRCALLRHNAAVLGREAVLEVHEGDCVELVPQLQLGQGGARDSFVVFLDPPWGGLSYKDQEVCELFLSDVPLSAVITNFLALPGCAWCVVKVPFNFDAAALRGLKGAEAAEPRLLSLSKMVKCLLVRAAAVHAAGPPQARVPKRPAAAAAAVQRGGDGRKEQKRGGGGGGGAGGGGGGGGGGGAPARAAAPSEAAAEGGRPAGDAMKGGELTGKKKKKKKKKKTTTPPVM